MLCVKFNFGDREMNAYPFIGGIDDDCKVLLIKDGYGIAMEHPTIKITGLAERNWNNSCFKNITTEYLANTYGEVKSEGHANFLVALAKNNGLRVYEASHPIKRDYFTFSKYGKLFFFSKESQMDFKSRKQITIPLPPESNVNAPEEDFEMKQVEKNNGDNLIFGDADKCEEWPCVGDEVLINIDFDKYDVKYGKEVNGENGVVRSIFKDGDTTVYAISVDGTCYCFVRGLLSKPKTPEEELVDEIESIFRSFSANPDCLIGRHKELAVKFVNDFNITKKPQ